MHINRRDPMDHALHYLCFCYGQQWSLNGYIHIFEVLQFNGTTANTAWPIRNLKYKMAAIFLNIGSTSNSAAI